jgi:trimethylamine--corrinoid protein Co-methyltransferase
MTNLFKILSDEDAEKIHQASLNILERNGVTVEHDVYLDTLKNAGAVVDAKRKIAHLPRDLVMNSIKKAPERFIEYGRTSEHNLQIEKGKIYARPSTDSVNIVDLATGERRRGVRSDIERCAALVDALENVRMASAMLYPSDVAPDFHQIVGFVTMLKNTEKHILATAASARDLEYMAKMADIAMRGKSEQKRGSLMTALFCPTSPLYWDKENVEMAALACKYRVAAIMKPTPISGATAPVTLAGQLALANSEALAGITLFQVISPGTPIYYGPRFMTTNMRTGQSSFGSIEGELMMAMAALQIGNRYGIPCESVTRREFYFPVASAGLNLIGNPGSIEAAMTLDMAEMVMDNEMLGMTFRALRGMQVDSETLALDVIDRALAGEQFLAAKHTRDHYTQEHYLPQLLSSAGNIFENRKDAVKSASEKAKEILKRHKAPELEAGIVKELDSLLNDATRRSSLK